ncbi:hypothetical protein [Rhodococcus qingshengii]|uniref:hypothetical protein n=1 Tax=Rhodococcus qingshengii TaxID=334542 RepID=UPI00071D2ED9|nr:hypothetical protein [Rhodococcus qingshengii]KSU80774.1 hypothetical protein AS032_08300 [Rhodococcus qingshengii]SCC11189.1 hypothetical protein GA0061093_103433 [Rhodococcus qingshengii]
MTAPDPGLTDLIAAHKTRLGGVLCECGWIGGPGEWAAHVALVVEQHTNGRTAELEAAVVEAERQGVEQFNLLDETLTADRNRIAKRCNIAEATIARVRGEVSAYSEIIPAVALADLRAALEGEQQ